jgi:hypothetical protein
LASFRRDILLKTADIFEAQKKEAAAFQVEETSCEASRAGSNVTYGVRLLVAQNAIERSLRCLLFNPA